MEFTKTERAILINQLEILAILSPEIADDYREAGEILSKGFTVFYDDVLSYVDEELPLSECRLVLDTLDMFWLLEQFYSRHPESDASSHTHAHFHGFDGNNETEMYSFARFLIEKQGKFQEVRGAEEFRFNSHMQKASKYGSMVETWKGLPDRYELTEEQVLEILESQ